jgi:uncharacterized protein (TIGR02996 family)
MATREDFLRAIVEEPDDDTHRLVFADWLDEHGELARAEFIRVQIELARGAKGRRKGTLEARQRDLLAAHAAEWIEPIRQWIYEDWSATPYTFCRGFVEEIDVLGETLVECGRELFAAAPIRGVRMPDEESFDELAKCKHLLRLRLIDLTASGLSSNFGPARLFRSRYLANLETLMPQGYDDNCHLDVAGIRGIVRSKYLGRLKHLDVSNNWFGAEGTVALLGPSNLTSLQRLDLEGVGMGDEGAVALAGTPWLARLKQLSLIANGIGDRGARALLESPILDSIEQLDLRDNEAQDEDTAPVSRETRRRLRQRFGKRVLL